MKKRDNHVVGFLFIHLLVYSIYNLGHPVTPRYIDDLNGPIYLTGVLFAIMALAQFVFAPFWGQVSDKFGRRIAFIGPFGYFFGQLGFVFLSDPLLLVFTRFLSGAFAITTLTVHFAYIADKASINNKNKYLGIATLFLPLGIFFGYIIGGFLGDIFSPRTTFLIQAIASLIMSIILFKYVDSPKKDNASLKDIKWNIIKEDFAIIKRNSDTCMNYILIITFLNIVSYQLLISQATVILNSGFHKTSTFIGIFVALYNLLAAIISVNIQKALFKNKKENHTFLPYLSFFSILCCLIALLSSFSNVSFLWIGLMFATILNTIFLALIQIILTKIDIHNEIGALIGINQAIQSLGVFTGAFCGGILVSNMLFAPIFFALIVFCLTFITNRFVVSKQIDLSIMSMK